VDKILEYIEKILTKANDKQAYNVFSVEHRSTFDKPFYMVTISWTKKDIPPLRIAEYTKAEVLAELKRYYRTQKQNDLQRRYHEMQIDASERVIKYHKEMIDQLEPKKKKKK